jgi:hypothetical protein
MLFLKGLECPTQYFDGADSRSDAGMRAAPPCAGANSEADPLPGRRREVGLAMIHSAPEAIHFDLNRVKLAIV